MSFHRHENNSHGHDNHNFGHDHFGYHNYGHDYGHDFGDGQGYDGEGVGRQGHSDGGPV